MSKKKEREKDKEVTSTTNDKRKTELDARKLKIELGSILIFWSGRLCFPIFTCIF